MAVQFGLCQTWSETPKTGFPQRGSNLLHPFCFIDCDPPCAYGETCSVERKCLKHCVDPGKYVYSILLPLSQCLYFSLLHYHTCCNCRTWFCKGHRHFIREKPAFCLCKKRYISAAQIAVSRVLLIFQIKNFQMMLLVNIGHV